MKQESNFCIGYKDYMTPVVTAGRFKCHLRTGAGRKAAARDCWFGALTEGARRLSVFCSDALSQWEQCFLTIFFFLPAKNLMRQAYFPMET